MQALKDALEGGAATIAWSVVHSAQLEQRKLESGAGAAGEAESGNSVTPSPPQLICATGETLQAERPRVILDSAALWRQFYSVTNEMIVTKAGRRMFPVLKLHVSDLDPTAMYSLVLEFRCTHQHRWRFLNGSWQKGSSCEDNAELRHAFVHFASVAPGSHWMQEPVSFAKLKLSNRENGASKIKLNSLHKYQPYVHLIKFSTSPRQQLLHIDTFTFTETQFIAVTAYQNDKVTQMKIKNNPFAKAFLGGSSTERAHNCTYIPSLTMGDSFITRLHSQFIPPTLNPASADLLTSSPPPYQTPYPGLPPTQQTYFQYHHSQMGGVIQGGAVQGATYSQVPEVQQQQQQQQGMTPHVLMPEHYPCQEYVGNGPIEVYDEAPNSMTCYTQQQSTFLYDTPMTYYSPTSDQISPNYIPKPHPLFNPDDEVVHTPHSATPPGHTPHPTTPSTSSSTSHSPPPSSLIQSNEDQHRFFFLPMPQAM